MRTPSMKSPTPKEEPSAPLQGMYLQLNFDEHRLFTAGNRKTDYNHLTML